MIVATIVVPTIPTSRSPRKRIARSANVNTRPNKATKIGHVVKLPSETGTPLDGGCEAMIPEL